MAAMFDAGRARKLARGLSTSALVVAALLATTCRADSLMVTSPFGADTLAVGFVPSSLALTTGALTVDVPRLVAGTDSVFSVQRPDSGFLSLELDRIESIAPDRAVWHGRVTGDPWSTVTIAIVRNALSGSIRTSRGELFRLRSRAGQLVIEEIPWARIPDDLLMISLADASAADSTGSGTPCVPDDPERIDVLVVYTDKARDSVGGDDEIEVRIREAVSAANKGYRRSLVRHHLRLAHFALAEGFVEQDDDDDVGDYLTLLLGTPTTAPVQKIRELREAHAADVVVLLVENGGISPVGPPTYGEPYAGYSTVSSTVSLSNQAKAYCVVVLEFATTGFSFGHEIGHLLSARHDWGADDDDDEPFAFNHGLVRLEPAMSTTPPWRTIMGSKSTGLALSPQIHPQRLNYYSSPDLDYMGESLGSTATGAEADNARTLNATYPTVAAYRCPPPLRTDTWMKDAWNDTGAEPEFDLVNEPMWKSPYLWVRTTQDPTRQHAHEHQNPRAGQVNYIYVKLHNGTAGRSGNLEISAARASTGLAWPDPWVRIATIPVSGLGEGETRIVEGSWTPDESGHLCLLARWISSEDPMIGEGRDIAQNVRGNNNIIWRNLNVLGPIKALKLKASFTVRNPTSTPQPYSLIVKPGHFERDGVLFGGSAVVFQVHGAILANWIRGGQLGAGFERTGSSFRITSPRGAMLRGLTLEAAEEREVAVSVDLSRIKLLPRRNYEIDVVQVVDGKPKARLRPFGGVSYVIPRKF